MEQIEEMTNKWFDQTLSYMTKLSGPSGKVDTLIAACFLCGRKYCKGVFSLLKNDHKLPAAAILRILFELEVKLRWCLQTPDNNECFQRFQRWNLHSLSENQNMYKNLGLASSGTQKLDAEAKARELEANIESRKKEGLKCIPNVACICKDQLSPNVDPGFAKLYPRMYLLYNSAVHLDFAVLQGMVDVSDGQVRFRDDPPIYHDRKRMEDECVALGCDVNLVVRTHYAWDFDEMLREFRAL